MSLSEVWLCNFISSPHLLYLALRVPGRRLPGCWSVACHPESRGPQRAPRWGRWCSDRWPLRPDCSHRGSATWGLATRLPLYKHRGNGWIISAAIFYCQHFFWLLLIWSSNCSDWRLNKSIKQNIVTKTSNVRVRDLKAFGVLTCDWTIVLIEVDPHTSALPSADATAATSTQRDGHHAVHVGQHDGHTDTWGTRETEAVLHLFRGAGGRKCVEMFWRYTSKTWSDSNLRLKCVCVVVAVPQKHKSLCILHLVFSRAACLDADRQTVLGSVLLSASEIQRAWRMAVRTSFLPTLTAAMTGAVIMDRATPPVMARFLLWRDDFFSS